LTGWELGLNYRLNDQLSIFSNYNDGYQAPDIDRFFGFDPYPTVVFNQFITPAEIKTINFGLNHQSDTYKAKVSVFYSDLKNEIYYDGTNNTNLDDSHKYGLEIQHKQNIAEDIDALVNYSWIRAIIDHETGQSFDGRNLPGVSRHTTNISVDYEISPLKKVNINHSWRSSADNIAALYGNYPDQIAYQSTDIKYTQSILRNKAGLFINIKNIFEKENGINSYDSIYPVDFTRNWQIGLSAKF
jgi:iron complex outermembrane receptor protein